MIRSISVFVAVVIIGVGAWCWAEPAHVHGKGPVVKVISSVDIDEEVNGKKSNVTTIEVTFEPGVAGTPHRHPGAIFGYVIEGEFEFAIGDELVKQLKAGDTFYEPVMVLHRVSRNPSDKTKTRVLATMVHPRDAKELVIPEPEKAPPAKSEPAKSEPAKKGT